MVCDGRDMVTLRICRQNCCSQLVSLEPRQLQGTALGSFTLQLPSMLVLCRGMAEWCFPTRAEQQHLQEPPAGLPPNSFMHARISPALQVLLL